MKLRARDRAGLSGSGARFRRPASGLTACLERPAGTILLQEEAGAADHSRVNAGRQHMSSAGTRVSVIVGVCQQDPERWRDFDSIYRPILFAYLRKRGLEESHADDVVQDIFVKLLSGIHTYERAKSKFRSWLFTVAQNTLVDRARRRTAYTKAVPGWAAPMLRATDSDNVKMAEECVKLHRQKILEHALKTIRKRTSSKVWACFEQHLLRNRRAAEIAAELKIEPNAVYVNGCRFAPI
jgi:RNA polymerase sigma factor (sigma-70 family)